jgi:hypothetical protein
MVSRDFATRDIKMVPNKPLGVYTVPAINPSRTLDELASLGGDIFDRQVRPALRPEDNGKFVAIDVGTGDYEIDDDDLVLEAAIATGSEWIVTRNIRDMAAGAARYGIEAVTPGEALRRLEVEQ